MSTQTWGRRKDTGQSTRSQHFWNHGRCLSTLPFRTMHTTEATYVWQRHDCKMAKDNASPMLETLQKMERARKCISNSSFKWRPTFLQSFIKKKHLAPGWCGSMDGAPVCEPTGHWFDSQSGHTPGRRARSPVGGTWEATTPCYFSPSLSPSLPLYLKMNT